MITELPVDGASDEIDNKSFTLCLLRSKLQLINSARHRTNEILHFEFQ
jgi:hypothetical protein